jgi:hypothetical protein
LTWKFLFPIDFLSFTLLLLSRQKIIWYLLISCRCCCCGRKKKTLSAFLHAFWCKIVGFVYLKVDKSRLIKVYTYDLLQNVQVEIFVIKLKRACGGWKRLIQLTPSQNLFFFLYLLLSFILFRICMWIILILTQFTAQHEIFKKKLFLFTRRFHLEINKIIKVFF